MTSSAMSDVQLIKTELTRSFGGDKEADCDLVRFLIDVENETIRELEYLRDEIREKHKKCGIAKTVGNGVGIAGGVATTAAAVLGVLAAPVTGGASLLLGGVAAAGLGASVLGSATAVTASAVDAGFKKKLAEKLKDVHYSRQKIADCLAASTTVIEFFKMLEGSGRTAEEWKKIFEDIDKAQTFKCFLAGGSAFKTGLNGFMDARSMYRVIKILMSSSVVSASSETLVAMTKFMNPALALKLLQFTGNTGVKTTNSVLRTLFPSIHLAGEATKIGAKATTAIFIGLGVVGVGLDIYSIVDTWTRTPEMVNEIGDYIQALRDNVEGLESLYREFQSH